MNYAVRYLLGSVADWLCNNAADTDHQRDENYRSARHLFAAICASSSVNTETADDCTDRGQKAREFTEYASLAKSQCRCSDVGEEFCECCSIHRVISFSI